ncbi:MAG: DUF4956 domain-containing protein [Bacteroidota bacterium]
MLNDLQALSILSLDASQIVGNLAVSLLCGIVISYFYRWSHAGTTYQVSFVRSLIVLAMITSIVMMVIGNNLARAFGLVGAMSIIRFRTALKDAQDIVFVFFALAIGLAAGVGYRMLAVVSTFFVGGTLVILTQSKFGTLSRRDFVLQLTYRSADGDGSQAHESVLDRLSKRYRLINVKTREGGTRFDFVYEVDLKRRVESVELSKSLSSLPGVEQVNLYSDEEPDL